MESVAPPGGVMLSESTAHLVEHAAVLDDTELVSIKGKDKPVRGAPAGGDRPARWAGRARRGAPGRSALGDGGPRRHGGPCDRWPRCGGDCGGTARHRQEPDGPGGRGGRGWSRGRGGVGLLRIPCQRHSLPCGERGCCARRAASKTWTARAARARVRERVPEADAQDLLLLDDLLGIADPDVPLPAIDPDARRRRLTALLNTASLARTEPALLIIEDAHWIDAVSESMLADFLTVIPQTPSMVLITSRPEYEGALTRVHGAQTIALAPLADSDTAALIDELLGSDPSVGELAAIIAERAAGNPFFAEEMVRELVQRGVLAGERGNYVCRADVAEVARAGHGAGGHRGAHRPARRVGQAHVDRGVGDRSPLRGASCWPRWESMRCSTSCWSAELIDQVRFTASPEYAFRHPLIRAVAYESQLKSDRAQWHRRLATAIQERAPGSVEENAALIAEHLEAAGDLHTAYGWHMRAGAWSTNRDIGAARVSWERARRIADALPADDPNQLSMRIAPRTMLCATDWQAAVQEGQGRFAELRQLCGAAGDKVSLAIGMTGLAAELLYAGRSREGSRLASEQMALLESIGDPTLTMGLAVVAFLNWSSVGEFGEILRWSQVIIDLAGGDPAKGAGFGVGSPLAAALTWRGVARCWLGRPGWRQDFDDAVALARRSDPATLNFVVSWTYGLETAYGVVRADDSVVRTIEEAVQIAEGTSNDQALGLVKATLGIALMSRDNAADRHRGLELMMQAREWQRERAPSLAPVTELLSAPERARCGDRDGAIAMARTAVDELLQAGRFGYVYLGTGVLVETLLERGAEGDQAEAQEAVDRLANPPADQGSAMREITLLRLRALLSRARGDDTAFRDYRDRYRAMATELGFEGHIAWAEAMT